MARNVSSFDFKDKVALVTGGSTGIGRATALLFARSGAKVVIGDVNVEGWETVEVIRREGGAALFIETDVREARQVQHLVSSALEIYGGCIALLITPASFPRERCSPTWKKQRSTRLLPST